MHTQFLLNFDQNMLQKSPFFLLLADIYSTKWDVIIYVNMHILKLRIFALLMHTRSVRDSDMSRAEDEIWE